MSGKRWEARKRGWNSMNGNGTEKVGNRTQPVGFWNQKDLLKQEAGNLSSLVEHPMHRVRFLTIRKGQHILGPAQRGQCGCHTPFPEPRKEHPTGSEKILEFLFRPSISRPGIWQRSREVGGRRAAHHCGWPRAPGGGGERAEAGRGELPPLSSCSCPRD